MNFAQAARAERIAYFLFHGEDLSAEYAAFVTAVERWTAKAKSAGALESMTAAQYADSILDCAANGLAEEVKEYLGAGS